MAGKLQIGKFQQNKRPPENSQGKRVRTLNEDMERMKINCKHYATIGDSSSSQVSADGGKILIKMVNS